MATVGNALTGPDPAGAVAAGAISGLYIASFPENGDVTAVRFKLEDTGGTGDSFDVGIYSANARIGISTARTDISTVGTYEFTFGTPVTLTGGQPYRFVLGTSSTANSSIFTAGTGTYPRTQSNGSASPLPATNSGGWTDSGTQYASVEVVYTPAAAGGAPPSSRLMLLGIG